MYGADQERSPELLHYKKWKQSLLNTSCASTILQRLPPTKSAATENILRVHLQVAYWILDGSQINNATRSGCRKVWLGERWTK